MFSINRTVVTIIVENRIDMKTTLLSLLDKPSHIIGTNQTVLSRIQKQRRNRPLIILDDFEHLGEVVITEIYMMINAINGDHSSCP